MEVERYFEDAPAVRGDKPSLEIGNSVSNAANESDDNPSGCFECNICLESVQDPVVTLCGHLYCWPCIYKWLQFKGKSTSDEQKQPQCPVCKAEVSHTTLVPLYGKGRTSTSSSRGKNPSLGIVIPQRPLGPVCGLDTPRSPSTALLSPNLTPRFQRNYPYQPNTPNSQRNDNLSMVSPSGTATHLIDPMIGMFGEMIYARTFGNSLTNMYSYPNSYHVAGSTSPGFRRHVMQADKSLSRIWFFLFCWIMLCLVLF
ncbi:hypothetical protein ACFE04_030035 [Oxalis oulophora]